MAEMWANGSALIGFSECVSAITTVDSDTMVSKVNVNSGAETVNSSLAEDRIWALSQVADSTAGIGKAALGAYDAAGAFICADDNIRDSIEAVYS